MSVSSAVLSIGVKCNVICVQEPEILDTRTRWVASNNRFLISPRDFVLWYKVW